MSMSYQSNLSLMEEQQGQTGEPESTAHWCNFTDTKGQSEVEACLSIDTVGRPARRLFPKITGNKKRKPVVSLPLADLAKASVLNQYGNNKAKASTEKERAVKRKQEEDAFVHEALRVHNEYRCLHGNPNLEISEKLCVHAREWANEIAARDMLYHGKCALANGDVIGENVYTCWTSDGNTSALARDAVRAWYSEEELYNYDKPNKSFKTQQFTQLVWKDTRQFGIGWARSSEGSIYVVANYSPVGNRHATFHHNVPPPIRVETLTQVDSDSSAYTDSDVEGDTQDN